MFYWTLNNLFSLGKNLICKVRYAKKAGTVLLAAAGVAAVVFAVFGYQSGSVKRKLLVAAVGMLLMVPAAWQILKSRIYYIKCQEEN